MDSALKKFSNYIRFYYFQYTIITTVAMMEPVERYIFNAIFLVFFSLFIYTTVIFLPGHLVMMLHFVAHGTGLSTFLGGIAGMVLLVSLS